MQCRPRRNGWAMSVARIDSVSDSLDAISTSLQLGFPTSHVCCEQVNQNLAWSCQIQVEISEKNVECENEMELLAFPTHCGRLAQENGTLRRPAVKTLEPSHLQALRTFGLVQNSSVHIAEYVEKAEKSVDPSVSQSCDLGITKV